MAGEPASRQPDDGARSAKGGGPASSQSTALLCESAGGGMSVIRVTGLS